MTRILLVETASPKRICHKLEQILDSAAVSKPEISILCRESSKAAFQNRPGITLYFTEGRENDHLRRELNKKKFDAVYSFWTGERQYRRLKLLALRLKAEARYAVAGDGNEFRVTLKAACRHAVFRWQHPLPTDHWDYAPPPATPDGRAAKRQAEAKKELRRERILILQSAEPSSVLQALERLKEKPLFENPRFTLFCRNRPDVIECFRDHPMLSRTQIHVEARDSWKHLRELRRSGFDGIVLFLTGDPSYWKLKLFAFLLGVSLKRTLIFNESADCFFFSWRQWLALVLHRLQTRPAPDFGSKWSHSARILVSLILKSAVLPFRFFWLLLVWFRLRSAGLRFSRKNNDDSLRLPLFPGT
jgi:hypothetical protein